MILRFHSSVWLLLHKSPREIRDSWNITALKRQVSSLNEVLKATSAFSSAQWWWFSVGICLSSLINSPRGGKKLLRETAQDNFHSRARRRGPPLAWAFCVSRFFEKKIDRGPAIACAGLLSVTMLPPRLLLTSSRSKTLFLSPQLRFIAAEWINKVRINVSMMEQIRFLL